MAGVSADGRSPWTLRRDEMDQLERILAQNHSDDGRSADLRTVSVTLLRWVLIEIRTLRLMVSRYREMADDRCACGRVR